MKTVGFQSGGLCFTLEYNDKLKQPMKYYNRNNLKNGRQLRRNMTKEERRLWFDFLSHCPVKVYRQRLIGNYIVDFYCSKAKLVIEIDGGQHYDEGANERNDIHRTQYLISKGLEVVRFTNLDVRDDFEGVCNTISRIMASKIEHIV